MKTWGGIPVMLTLVAWFITHAENKWDAYATLMEDQGKWENGHLE